VTLDTLFPPGVVVETARDADADAPLHEDEAACVARAVPHRVAEFRQGRAAARRALGRLGFPPTAIPAGVDRAPQWPAGIVGSIAHTEGRCVAALAAADRIVSIGFDVERARPLPARIRALVCTVDELAWADARTDDAPWHLLTFVAKEAFYKAWYPLTRTFIGFHDVALRFDPAGVFVPVAAGGHCTAKMLTDYAGRWARDEEFVYAAAWITAAPPDRASSAPTSG